MLKEFNLPMAVLFKRFVHTVSLRYILMLSSVRTVHLPSKSLNHNPLSFLLTKEAS